MPYTLNGIGTWYHGRRRIESRMDVCEFCGRAVELQSYDTTNYFVVFFIPLIPLGEKRVLTECPSCRKHRAMPLKDYEKLRQGAIQEAIAKYRSAPGDAALLAAALQTMVNFQDRPSFEMIAGGAAQKFPNDALVQGVLGSGWFYFEEFEQAALALGRSLAAKDDEATRENLARALCRARRPEQAVPLVQHLLDGSHADTAGLVYFVIESCQATGAHAEGQKLLDALAGAYPGMAGTKEFRTYADRAARGLESGKRFESSLLKSARKHRAGEGRIGWQFARFIGPALAALLLGGYLVRSWMIGRSHEVFFVNGLDHAYSVNVGGRWIKLPPRTGVPLGVPEGVVRIGLEPGGSTDSISVEFHTPFFSRVFAGRRRVVINPDRAALLMREIVVYSSQKTPGLPAPGPDPVFLAGSALYQPDGIDDAFVDSPPSVKMSSSVASSTRTRLSIPQGTLANTCEFLKDAARTADLKNALTGALELTPDDPVVLALYAAEIGEQELVARLKPLLARRPVQINVHRIHQSLSEKTVEAAVLEGEYRALTAKEPDNRALLYLLGRVVTNRIEARQLFEQSERGPKPIGYGHNALAFDFMARGQFEEALPHAEAAEPFVADGVRYLPEVRLALGQYDRLREEAAARLRRQPLSLLETLAVAELFELAGNSAEADRTIETLLARQRAGRFAPEESATTRRVLSGQLAYFRNKPDEFLANAAKSQHYAWMQALMRGSAKDAEAAMRVIATRPSDYQLAIVTAMAVRDRDEALAGRMAAELAAALAANGKDERTFSGWLAGSVVPSAEDLNGITLNPQNKCVLLLALASRVPATRDAALPLARKLNFHPGFPQHEIRALIEQLGSDRKTL